MNSQVQTCQHICAFATLTEVCRITTELAPKFEKQNKTQYQVLTAVFYIPSANSKPSSISISAAMCICCAVHKIKAFILRVFTLKGLQSFRPTDLWYTICPLEWISFCYTRQM